MATATDLGPIETAKALQTLVREHADEAEEQGYVCELPFPQISATGGEQTMLVGDQQVPVSTFQPFMVDGVKYKNVELNYDWTSTNLRRSRVARARERRPCPIPGTSCLRVADEW